MAEDSAPMPSATTAGANDPETDAFADQRDSKPWLKMVEDAEKAFAEWQDTCDNIAKTYANLKTLAKARTHREFQMFYANLEVLKPSIYARAPQPVVVPRFKDRKPVPRKASEMLERALVTSFDTEKVHETLKRVRDDLALCARGAMWERYETYETAEGEVKECVRYEWVHRRDFLHEPARIWGEVGWVARRSWLTKEQGEKRFGEEAWKEIKYENAKDTADEYQVDLKAAVWELWHKGRNVVVWLHPNASKVLDIAAPHLTLEGFFPCPRPAYGVCESDTLIPVPDACFYKDQLEEINELTARISALSESLRLVGFYASGAEEIGPAIEAAIEQVNSGENRRTLIPVALSTAFSNQGGLKDAIIWMPVVEVAQTVTALVALRKQLIDDVYQISGISDIMRGQTEASETLGAQQLKSQYGSIRIKDRQGEMVRIADGALNIAGEIMAENFSPESIMAMSQTDDLPKQADVLKQHEEEAQKQIAALAQQAMQPPAPPQPGQPPAPSPDPAQFEQAKQKIILQHQQEAAKVVTVEQVFGLLRGQRVRPFVLMIATDSTIQPDENAEKQARNEFGTAFAQTTGALAPMIQAEPGTADFAGEMLKFMLAPFRAGRQMEQSIDDFVQQMTEKSKQPPPPSPEAEAMKLDAEIKQADLEDRKAERVSKAQQAEREAAEEAAQAERDAAAQAIEAKAKADQSMRDAMIADAEARAKVAEIERKAQADAQKYAHEQALQAGEIRLQELAIELAELKIKEAREKPAPKPNGSGEARA